MPNLIEHEAKKRLLHIGTALGIVASGALATYEAQAQENTQLLHGDGSRNRLNILLFDYSGDMKLVQEVAEDIFLIAPLNEFKDKVNIYTKRPTENLKCDQNADCDWAAIVREIDHLIAGGTILHKSLVVVRSNEQFRGAGLATIANRSVPPDVYTYSAIVRPQGVPDGPRREFYAAAIAHELWGHAFAGFGHEGGDLMTHYSGVNSFNEQHTQFLRAHMALSPRNYLTPKSEIKVTVGSLNLQAELILSAGTTQVRHIITPFNNDGPGADLIRNPESNVIIPAPPEWYGLLPDMTYTWQMYSSGVLTPLLKDDSRWTQFEGWPGIFFPNTPAETKIRTPKRDSSKIVLKTLSAGQETNSLTPILVWDNGDRDVYYYEVQVSKDETFNIDPQTATAMVYHELRHGGLTNPLNSYQIPKEFPLEKDTKYFWRVRPRIQGDSTPVLWSNPQTFKTSSDARVQMYSQELIDKDYGNSIIGPSKEDYDKANPQPEPIQPSPLARVLYTSHGRIFIPEATPPHREEQLTRAA